MHLTNLPNAFIDASSRKKAIPVFCVPPSPNKLNLPHLNNAQRNVLKAQNWKQTVKNFALIPNDKGELASVVFVLESEDEYTSLELSLGHLPARLPAGTYELKLENYSQDFAALSWLLGAYKFETYKSNPSQKDVRLKLPKEVDHTRVTALADGVWLGRDCINTPANDFGPEELENVSRRLAKIHKAKIQVITGDALLKQNFPLIHTVGRASTRAPRLINISWGDKKAPLITLVGKGICYDTGGLNIKPGNSMSLMKKDMGGAATTLALAHMIMSVKLPIHLRVLIPAAENSVSGNAFRPGDVLPSRNGMHVEIGNTDAEGRLVLADALALAGEENPDHIMTFATLTGAARIALGTDLPAFYSTDDLFADDVIQTSMVINDPVWRMPFWQPYNKLLKSKIGDINHIASTPFAGSITAALFLKRFVNDRQTYSHFDMYGWTPSERPGKSYGGEPQCARAVFEVLEKKYAT